MLGHLQYVFVFEDGQTFGKVFELFVFTFLEFLHDATSFSLNVLNDQFLLTSLYEEINFRFRLQRQHSLNARQYETLHFFALFFPYKKACHDFLSTFLFELEPMRLRSKRIPCKPSESLFKSRGLPSEASLEYHVHFDCDPQDVGHISSFFFAASMLCHHPLKDLY